MAIAFEWEKASRKAEAGMLAEAQARRVVSEIYEIAAGQSISFVSTEEFLNDWIVKKRQTNAEGTALRYQRTVQSFLQHLGTKAKRSLSADPFQHRKYLGTEIADGKNATTCNTAIKTLRSALNIARVIPSLGAGFYMLGAI